MTACISTRMEASVRVSVASSVSYSSPPRRTFTRYAPASSTQKPALVESAMSPAEPKRVNLSL